MVVNWTQASCQLSGPRDCCYMEHPDATLVLTMTPFPHWSTVSMGLKYPEIVHSHDPDLLLRDGPLGNH